MFTSNHYDWTIIGAGSGGGTLRISWRRRGRTFSCWNVETIRGGLETVCGNPAHQGLFH